MMIPVLEKCFGFTSELSIVITMLYIIVDPFVTAFNVLGNNIFALYLDKVFSIMKAKSDHLGVKLIKDLYHQKLLKNTRHTTNMKNDIVDRENVFNTY